MLNIIEANKNTIVAFCRKYKVHTLAIFGSALTDRFNEKSDIDFIVDFADVKIEDYAENYLNLQESLQKLLGREIDLLEDKAIQNSILRQNITNTKQVIYG